MAIPGRMCLHLRQGKNQMKINAGTRVWCGCVIGSRKISRTHTWPAIRWTHVQGARNAAAPGSRGSDEIN